MNAAPRATLYPLRPHHPVGAELTRCLEGILAYATQVTSSPDLSSETALHEYRKSVRRARALIAFLRPVLHPAAQRDISHCLRRAVRETSPLRDLDALVVRVRGLSDKDGGEGLLEVLEAQRSSARTREVLDREAGWLSPIASWFAGGLPEDLSVDDLEALLCASFRRARKAHRRVRRRSRPGAAVHAWRKRVKELRYQLELFVGWGAGETGRELASLAEQLGDLTDRMALKKRLRRDAVRAPRASRSLAKKLEARGRKRLRKLLESSRPLFRRSPTDFAASVLGEELHVRSG